jgi:hypothetical protein
MNMRANRRAGLEGPVPLIVYRARLDDAMDFFTLLSLVDHLTGIRPSFALEMLDACVSLGPCRDRQSAGFKFFGGNGLEADTIAGSQSEKATIEVNQRQRRAANQAPATGALQRINAGLPAG